jgi:hypothetical protein
VLWVDEKTQVQALDRTAPILPLLPGDPQRATHDDTRHGTTNLYAAPEVASGKVISQRTARHRATEFKWFLAQLDRSVPADLAVDVIGDNSSTHKTPPDPALAGRPPPVPAAFHPDLKLLAQPGPALFAELTTKWLRRGTHRSVAELDASIQAWIDTWNDNPRPFVWTKTADEILDTIASYRQRINNSVPGSG